MRVKLTDDKYLSNMLFADDPVIIARDEYDIDYMIAEDECDDSGN